jgi:uncharacterized membrane protein
MRKRILSMTSNAMLVAIILIMGFFPQFGFIQLLPILPAFTLIHIPVLIGCYFNGWKGGLFYGATFGIVSFLQALLNPGPLNLIFLSPFISIFPRIIFGLIAGILFLNKLGKQVTLNSFLTSIKSFVLTIIHSVLVLSSIVIFIGPPIIETYTIDSILGFVLPILIFNSLGEAFLALFLVPLIIFPIHRLKLYNN